MAINDSMVRGGFGRGRGDAAFFAPATRDAGPTVCVIAEIGVNHDGRLDRALDLVDAARDVGADAVKLQLFDPRHLLSQEAVLADYQKRSDSDVFEMLDRLKLPLDDMLAVRDAAREAGLGFIVTPFSLEMFDAMVALDPDAVKIASPDVVNLPLIQRMATLRLPMIISTGAAMLEEIGPATRVVRELPTCLLHCVSSYPTSDTDATLNAMTAMAARYALPVGYSDHTTHPLTGALAVAAGACVIEKHLTYDRNAAGPDHAASFDPVQFLSYVGHIRQAEKMLGPRCKVVEPAEREVRHICRQSVCATRDLEAGHVLTEKDLTVKRPGHGIPAARMTDLIGRALARRVHANHLLHESDLLTASEQAA